MKKRRVTEVQHRQEHQRFELAQGSDHLEESATHQPAKARHPPGSRGQLHEHLARAIVFALPKRQIEVKITKSNYQKIAQ